MKYKLKQKQNQRITRITESTLVVGADIAKKIHVARAVDFRGIELGKDCVFHNDQEGLTKLATWMKELRRVHDKTDIVFGIEPTGHYWFPLAEFLQEQGIKIVVVNPHHVNKSKELEDNSPDQERLQRCQGHCRSDSEREVFRTEIADEGICRSCAF